MKKQVAIIDYGMGNLHSVASAIQHVDADVDVAITADQKTILSADHVILPGVGAIRDCMHEIRRVGADEAVAQVIAQKQPLLGVCVGMQALMTHSEENNGIDCLNVFDGQVRLFQGDEFRTGDTHLKVPHMGWNNVATEVDHPIWQGIHSDSRFYFVHSYFVEPNQDYMIGSCEYGVRFAAMLARDNVVAVQFHPEKSHVAGLRLLRNFLGWNGQP
ncbi:Imidazole glycerol phosphate synthase subunit HisH [BD1-7 clade bacterium]|uniref:Imidazole glycerol phosphate synthase subunit HisH n=1 Tax=BD1-7 clade bacterium TaxID=2029982 RepID=A0A5S9MRV9_9GAMM|nr:Imidazole glycerol phosphate synthase subunit HisH [BD1-7 clade bacterium]CAA0085206.1 Imidazole glycerol phosphate synthase subunit HisH [BD1-7 clade bacterium]